MSDYIIKGYNEDFIEDQVNIGSTLAKEWLAYTQSNVEQVKQVYSRDDFDPETRLYCFKDDKMVGYIGATIRDDEEEKIKISQTRLAFALPGHEEAYDLLYDELLKVLKKKEVKRIESPQNNLNGNTYELAKKKGFEYSRSVAETYLLSPDKFKKFETEEIVDEYNHEKEIEYIIKMFDEAYEQLTPERIQTMMNNLMENPNILAQRTVKKDGEILAYGCLIKSQKPNLTQLPVFCGINSEYKKHVLSDLIGISKEKGFERTIVYLNPNNPTDQEEAKDIVTLGFEKVGQYDVLMKEI